MRKSVLLFVVLLGLVGAVQAQVQVGVSVGGGGDSFYLALGNYYHAPPEQVTVCQQRHIPDEEMPVVFFVAQRAHVAPGVIVDLRAGGTPWVDIFARYRVNPRVLYVKGQGDMRGTPYAGYYAYYRGGHGARIMDADIVNMVNLRFASEYYHRTPDEVARMRAGGHDYRYIHSHYWHPAPKGPRGHEDRGRRDHGNHWDERHGNRPGDRDNRPDDRDDHHGRPDDRMDKHDKGHGHHDDRLDDRDDR